MREHGLCNTYINFIMAAPIHARHARGVLSSRKRAWAENGRVVLWQETKVVGSAGRIRRKALAELGEVCIWREMKYFSCIMAALLLAARRERCILAEALLKREP